MQCSTAVFNAVAVVVTWTLQHNEIGLVHPSSVLWSWIPIVQTAAAAVAVRHLLTGQQQIGACTILDTQQTTNNKQQTTTNKQQPTTTKQQQTTTTR
jgi:hypothetical protein